MFDISIGFTNKPLQYIEQPHFNPTSTLNIFKSAINQGLLFSH